MKTIAFTSAILFAATIFSGNSVAQQCYQCGDTLCSSITNARPVATQDSRIADRYRYGYRSVDPNREPDRIFYLDDEELGKDAIRVEQYFMNGYGGQMCGGGYPGIYGYPGMYGGNMGYGYPGYGMGGYGYGGYGYGGYGMGGYGMGGYGMGGYGMGGYGGYPYGYGGYPYGYRRSVYGMW